MFDDSFQFELSCLLLKLEYGYINFEETKSWIDNKLVENEDTSKLVDVSLASNSNNLIASIYETINHQIHPSAYQVGLADVLKKNDSNDNLQNLDKIIEYLQTNENKAGGIEYYKQVPFLETLFDFSYWVWDQLHLTRLGLFKNLDSLESHLNDIFENVMKFEMHNQPNWERQERKVISLINKVKQESFKN